MREVGRIDSRVQYDVVAHAVRVGVRDETVVRPIVVKCRSEVKSNEAKVVPSLSSGVVHDDEGATGCDGVGQEVVGFAKNAMSCGDGGKVGVGT